MIDLTAVLVHTPLFKEEMFLMIGEQSEKSKQVLLLSGTYGCAECLSATGSTGLSVFLHMCPECLDGDTEGLRCSDFRNLQRK